MGWKLKRFKITIAIAFFVYIIMNVKSKPSSLERIPSAISVDVSAALRTIIADGASNASSLWRRRTVFPADTINVVVLSSGPRSGSTFLGELIALPPSTFYFYEPRHMMSGGKYNEKTLSTELHRLFTCNFSGLNFTSPVRVYRTMRHGTTAKCLLINRRCPAPTQEQMQKLCMSATYRVLKTVRMPVGWIKNIVEDRDENVKLIHLVRDPRASFPSARKLGYSTAPEASRCFLIEKDLNASAILESRHPDKVIRVTYEQLCLQPWDIARELYHFIQYGNKAVCTRPPTKKTEESFTFKRIGENISRKPSEFISSSIHELETAQRGVFDPSQISRSSRNLIHDPSEIIESKRKINVNLFFQNHESPENLTYYADQASAKSLNNEPFVDKPTDEKVLKQRYPKENILPHAQKMPKHDKSEQSFNQRSNRKDRYIFQKEMNNRLELPSFVHDHLLVHLHPNILTSNKGDPHSTIRDHKSVYKVWRRVLTLPDLLATQDACRGVIVKLNHAFFDTLADLRNYSIDYVTDQWKPRTLSPC